MSIEWLGLPSSLDIVIDHTLEAADACGCISMEKASVERSTLDSTQVPARILQL